LKDNSEKEVKVKMMKEGNEGEIEKCEIRQTGC
jgi:hypothetical protein